MGIEPLGRHISLPEHASGMMRLKAGDIVTVNVIKRVSPSVWAVGVNGFVLRAKTSLQLTPGESLRALVVRNGDRCELKLSDTLPRAIEVAARAAGLPGDERSLLIVSSLIARRLMIDERTVASLRPILAKMKGDPRRNSRLLALLFDKGLISDAAACKAIADLCNYGAAEGQRERPGGKRKKSEGGQPSVDEMIERLKDAMGTDAARPAGPLSLFNHLAPCSGKGDWIVVPFRVGVEGEGLSGTLRFLYDVPSASIKKTVIVAYGRNGERLRFSLAPRDGGWRLDVFSDHRRLIGVPLSRWAEHVERLMKAGVACGERIAEDAPEDEFDGEEDGAYRRIDLDG